MKTAITFDENHFYTTKIELITPEIIQQFKTKLGLSYISENSIEGNLCFANNSELRQEFKLTFTNNDILNYINAFCDESMNNATYKIPYPKDTLTFWKCVETGFKNAILLTKKDR